MSAFLDLTGQRFGRLVVIRRAPTVSGRNTRWLCRCDCGVEKAIFRGSLRKGGTVSCGCWRKALGHVCNRTHGMRESPEYEIWSGMKKRCYNSRTKSYARYGGRGVTVCERWRGSFEAFLEDMGQRPSPQHTLERISSDGPYAPDNCKWATQAEQQNNRTNNRRITFRGETLTVAQWARRVGMRIGTLHHRLQHGWGEEQALTAPVKAPPTAAATRPESREGPLLGD